MADYEKLLEQFFEKKENLVGVKELNSIILKEFKNKLLSEDKSKAVSKVTAEQRTLKLPRLQISENWGKIDTIERSELERIVLSATSKDSDAFQKLEMIQKQMMTLASGKLGPVKKPQRILSQIMILETMNRLFKSFQPSPAGFINEALLSVFYGGKQTAAAQANVEKDIGDVTAKDGTPISIKTKISGKLKIDGSVENLYKSINEKGKVYFDIYEKVVEGGEGGEHVGKLLVSRLIVHADNINQFLGKDYFDQKVSKGKTILVPKGQFKVAGRSVSGDEEITEGRPRTKLDPSTDKIYQTFLSSPKTLLDKEVEKMTARLDRGQISALIYNVNAALETETDAEKKQRLQKYKSILGGIETSTRELEPARGWLDREFKISEQEWSNFAVKDNTLRHIEINFSDTQINAILQQAVKDLDSQVVEIFNSLDGFSNSINTYLTSEQAGRTNQGAVALQYAKKLEPQTKEVIKSVSDEKE